MMRLFVSCLFCYAAVISAEGTDNLWNQVGRMTGLLLRKCLDQTKNHTLIGEMLEDCLKKRTLFLLDGALRGDVISVGGNVELVRYRQGNNTHFRHLYGRSDNNNPTENWENHVVNRIANIFDTHLLKIHFTETEKEVQGRGRKKRQSMMLSLMAFGIAAMGLIMVPMGFQFLAVLGGKALLLAKMALLLTAIQGLKKIAKSNINYGLYATQEHSPHCKDEFCNYRQHSEEDVDSFVIDIDIDGISDQPLGHYERRWPTPEIEDPTSESAHYYTDEVNSKDLLHPHKYQPHPRIDLNTYL